MLSSGTSISTTPDVDTEFAELCAAINYGCSFDLHVPDVWVARRYLLARELGIPIFAADDVVFEEALQYTPHHPGQLARRERVPYHDLRGCADTDPERIFAEHSYTRLTAAATHSELHRICAWWEEQQEAV